MFASTADAGDSRTDAASCEVELVGFLTQRRGVLRRGRREETIREPKPVQIKIDEQNALSASLRALSVLCVKKLTHSIVRWNARLARRDAREVALAIALMSGILLIDSRAAPYQIVSDATEFSERDWLRDADMLAKLRTEGRFAEAEHFCRTKLANTKLAPRLRAEFARELSRTLAAHAVTSPPEARETLWAEAGQVIDDFLAKHPDYPRAIVLRLQRAMVTQGRGELARHEAELSPSDAKLPLAAQQHLREAIKQLAALQADVDAALRKAPRGAAGLSVGDKLSAMELVALDRHVRYQTAKAHQEIAETYPTGNDRIDALAQADKLLEPLAATTSDDEVVWQARVDRVRALRQLGRAEQAHERIEQLSSKSRPAWVDARLAIEQAFLASADGKFDAALALVEERKLATGGVDAAEADDLRLRIVLAAWLAAVRAGDDAEIAARHAAATNIVKRIETQHGPYWARRAKLQTAAAVAGGAVATSATLLAAVAECDFHAGAADEAIRNYDKAASAARESGDGNSAFRLALSAAAVMQQQKRLAEALDRYATLSRESPKHADAAKAHLQATWNAAHVFGPQSAEYRQLLDEHVKLWPTSPTADDAWLWSARAHESEQKWIEAIAAYRRVRPPATGFERAVAGVAACANQALAAIPVASTAERTALAEDHAKWFESIFAANGNAVNEPHSPVQRVAVVAAARLRLRHTSNASAAVNAILDAAKRRGSDAPREWLVTVDLLQIESHVLAGKLEEAENHLTTLNNQLGQSPRPNRARDVAVREMLSALAKTREAQKADANIVRRIAEIELSAGKLLGDADAKSIANTPTSAAARRRTAADALAAAGRRDESLAEYRKLAAEFPNDAAVQRGYAALLGQGQDRETMTAALNQWRLIEERTKSGTPEWFAAKYEAAALHERLGDKRQALRVVTLLAALYSDLGGAEMKSKFEAIRKRCQP
jgi:hypothetical protein